MRIAAILLAALALAVAARADSLFTKAAAHGGSLISDTQKKFDVGDLITVVVREAIDASTEANTDTRKESQVDAQAAPEDNTFLVSPRPDGLGLLEPERLPNWGVEIKNEHRTTGRTKRTNRLVTTVACTVTHVFDNGNVAIEGSKKVSVNREDSKLYVRGVLRARDVTPGNVIQSYQLADAVIELHGQGPLWNNQRRGLFTRLLDWFSPF